MAVPIGAIGLTGGAAKTTALAVSGPGYMLSDIATLGVIGYINEKLNN